MAKKKKNKVNTKPKNNTKEILKENVDQIAKKIIQIKKKTTKKKK